MRHLSSLVLCLGILLPLGLDYQLDGGFAAPDNQEYNERGFPADHHSQEPRSVLPNLAVAHIGPHIAIVLDSNAAPAPGQDAKSQAIFFHPTVISSGIETKKLVSMLPLSSYISGFSPLESRIIAPAAGKGVGS